VTTIQSDEAMCTQQMMPLLGRTMPRCPHPSDPVASPPSHASTGSRCRVPHHLHSSHAPIARTQANDAAHAHTTRRQNNVTLLMMLCTHARTQLMSCQLHLSQLASPPLPRCPHPSDETLRTHAHASLSAASLPGACARRRRGTQHVTARRVHTPSEIVELVFVCHVDYIVVEYTRIYIYILAIK
jgi:hypothetical protein